MSDSQPPFCRREYRQTFWYLYKHHSSLPERERELFLDLAVVSFLYTARYTDGPLEDWAVFSPTTLSGLGKIGKKRLSASLARLEDMGFVQQHSGNRSTRGTKKLYRYVYSDQLVRPGHQAALVATPPSSVSAEPVVDVLTSVNAEKGTFVVEAIPISKAIAYDVCIVCEQRYSSEEAGSAYAGWCWLCAKAADIEDIGELKRMVAVVEKVFPAWGGFVKLEKFT